MSLEKVVDVKHIERLAYVDPDKLAPSLGLVIRSIVESTPYEGEEYYHRPSIFFALTYPTQNFLNILRSVVQTFLNGGAKGIFLNLDMGSGKTHLLTLLLHLFATCNLVPEQCTDLQDYKNVGYDLKLAEKTIVFAFDLRTPKSVYSHQLKLTKIMLERMGLKDAATIIERSIDEGRMPDSYKLAEAIPRNVNILVLIDELYYGAVSASADPEERNIVKDVVKFVRELLDYRRNIPRRAGGIVVIVATARRDEQLWQKLRASGELEQGFIAAMENLMNQLDRILGTQETRWLSIEDAKRIIEKRLELPLNSFDKYYHSTFSKFIEKIIRVDTDVPQAHHMRSLIKAMAIFTLNAIKSRDSIVTPGHFDESIITMLLLGAENITQIYRSIYGEISSLIHDNKALQLAVNAIFALTITGDPQRLIDIVRIAKTGSHVSGSELRSIPLVEERELIDILKAHRFSGEIAKVIDDLAKLHTHIHSVQVPGRGYAFFVAPVASIVTLYTKTIEDRYRDYLLKPDSIVEYLVTGLLSLKCEEQGVEVEIISSIEEVQKKQHSKDKLYVYILADRLALSRMAKEPSKADEVLRETRKAVEEFLTSRPSSNIVFILPQINSDVIHRIARYLAIDDATRYVKEHYIEPLNRKSFGELSELDRILRELIRLELDDLVSEVNRRIGEATSAYTSAIKMSLVKAVYRTPGGIVEEPFNLYVEPKKGMLVKDLSKAIDMFQSTIQDVSANLRSHIIDKVRELRHMIFLVKSSTMYGYALETMLRDADEGLKKNNKCEIRVDDCTILQVGPDRFLYIPPSTMRSIANDVIVKLEQQYKNMLNVVTEKDRVIIELKPVSPKGSSKEGGTPESKDEGVRIEIITDRGLTSEQREGTRYRDITEAINELVQKGGGYIVLKVKIDKGSVESIKRYVSMLKRYITEWRAEAAAG
jgi:hypothetical protein